MRTDAKLLFADLYRYEAGIRANVKHAGKLTDELLKFNDWEYLSKLANVIWDEVEQIERQAENMKIVLDNFISAGDYNGETIHVTPMEQMAKEE